MKKGICYIVGAGDWFEMDFRPAENDFVIAADAGLRYLEQVGIPADLVIGDFGENRSYIGKQAEGIYLQDLKYPLENAALTNTFPIGTSNEFIGKKSRIAVKSGTLMVVFPKEAKEKMIC